MGSKLFVGNLEFKTTREELQTLFSQAGSLRDVVLPTDRATGRPRGFAFVEFETEEAAAQAIQRFDGHELNGRPLRVNAAQDRPPRPPGGGGGYRPSFDRGPAGGPSFDGGGFGGGFGSSGGGESRFGGGGGGGGGKSKGSRRNLRAKKRSL